MTQDETRWISVEDELPKEGSDVLVYLSFFSFTQTDICVMNYDDVKKGWWDKCDRFWKPRDVTHYMPLPEPPEVDHD